MITLSIPQVGVATSNGYDDIQWNESRIISNGLNNSFIGKTLHSMVLVDNSPNIVFYGVKNNSNNNNIIFLTTNVINNVIKDVLCESLGVNITENHEKPVIAVDNSKVLHIVWRGVDSSDTRDYEIFYIRYQNGVWSKPVNISKNNLDDCAPDMVIDKYSTIHLTWFTKNNTKYNLNYLAGTPEHWVFNQTIGYNVSSEASCKKIALAASNKGDIAIAFTNKSQIETSNYEVVIYERQGETWDKNALYVNDSSLYSPIIKYDAASNLHLLYIQYNYSSLDNGVMYTIKRNGEWQKPINVSATNKEITFGTFDIDINGRVHIVFSQIDNTNNSDYELFYVNDAVGEFTTPINITEDEINDYTPIIKLDSLGYAHIVYYYLNETNYYVAYIRSVQPVSATNYIPILPIIAASVTIVTLISLIIMKSRPAK